MFFDNSDGWWKWPNITSNGTNVVPNGQIYPGAALPIETYPYPSPMPVTPAFDILAEQTKQGTVRVTAELLKAIGVTPLPWWYCDVANNYYEIPANEWEGLVLARKQFLQKATDEEIQRTKWIQPEPPKEKLKRAISLKDI